MQCKQLVDELRSSLADNLDDAADTDTVLNGKVVKLQNNIISIRKEKQIAIDKCNKLDQVVRTLKVNINCLNYNISKKWRLRRILTVL